MQDSAKGVDTQGASFSTTRNGAPEAGTLRGPTEENLGDKVSGFFGHTTDHAKDVRATNQARDQAVDGINGYQQSSSSALQNSQALPVPPGMNLIAQPVEQQIGTTHVQGVAPGGGLSPAGGGPGGGPGRRRTPADRRCRRDPRRADERRAPGQHHRHRADQPRPVSCPTIPGAGPGGLRAPLGPLAMAEAAAVMGAGGAGGAGAAAQGERTVRGGGGGAGGAGAKALGKGAHPARRRTGGRGPRGPQRRAVRRADRTARLLDHAAGRRRSPWRG